ncbi:hypothetical protein T492DRAFT_1036274 [Pavlovales sp. CCMP2436]|nr:hypothetical protein T492DRAFT_1036274 [Pavlovales sp. CCMP2436]
MRAFAFVALLAPCSAGIAPRSSSAVALSHPSLVRTQQLPIVGRLLESMPSKVTCPLPRPRARGSSQPRAGPYLRWPSRALPPRRCGRSPTMPSPPAAAQEADSSRSHPTG